MEVLTKEQEHKGACRSLLTNKGFKLFREELMELVNGHNQEIKNMLNQSIKGDEIDKLNFSLGIKSGLQRVLHIIGSIEDDAK